MTAADMKKAPWLEQHLNHAHILKGERSAWLSRPNRRSLPCYELNHTNCGPLYSAYLALCHTLDIPAGEQPELMIFANTDRDGSLHNNGIIGELVEGEKTRLVIAISEGLMELANQEELLTFLAHELGHLVKHHAFTRMENVRTYPLQARKQEMEADQIAIAMMGSAPFISLQEKLLKAKTHNHIGPTITVRGYFTLPQDKAPSHAIRIRYAQQTDEKRSR